MSACQICRKDRVKVVLDCGPQPLCNRFVTDTNREEYMHPIVLGQCEDCGLIQLTQPVPREEIAPRFEWISYSEPEGHLDHLADVICGLPGITSNSVACGISFKDDSLLKRLENKKISRSWCINPGKNLGITISDANEQADIVIARHIYEHASDTHRLLDAVKKLVAPGGYVIFEVPDCTQVLDSKDYSMLWEEHNLYFTPDTFRSSFDFTDFSLIRYECYPYPVENALVGVMQRAEESEHNPLTQNVLRHELIRGSSYGKGLSKYREKLQWYLKEYRQNKGGIALFGAGHLACMYINLMEIKDYIAFVVDDNPNKKGLYMPGSYLPICGSDLLVKEKISLCLLSLRPESEEKIMQKNAAYIEKGGAFASIFPASKLWLNFQSYAEVMKGDLENVEQG